MHEVPPGRSRSQQESSDLVSSLLWGPRGCYPQVSRDEDLRLPPSDSAGRLASGNCFYLNILVSLPLSEKIRSRIYNLLRQEKLAPKNLFLSRAGHFVLILHLISWEVDWQGKLVKNKVIEYLPHVKLCGYWDQKMNKMKLDHLILFIAFH